MFKTRLPLSGERGFNHSFRSGPWRHCGLAALDWRCGTSGVQEGEPRPCSQRLGQHVVRLRNPVGAFHGTPFIPGVLTRSGGHGDHFLHKYIEEANHSPSLSSSLVRRDTARCVKDQG